MAHLTQKEQVDIVRAFTNRMIPVITLAEKYNKTRQGVYKVLKKHGVDTSAYQRLMVSCSVCDKEISRTRCNVRVRKNIFCSTECYYAFLKAGNGNPYINNRQGQRIARKKVSKIITLKPGYIVHHEDRNTLNNELWNLKVFRNQGDHTRHHRGFNVKPVWDGSKV